MATRGIIAVANNDTIAEGWRGSYSHWDNYPERMVGVLAILVERDGYDKVVKTLTADHQSWSMIDPFYDEDVPNSVKGYGVFHEDEDLTDDNSWYTHYCGWYSWASYAYVMTTEGVLVTRVVETGGMWEGDKRDIEPDAFHPWSTIMPGLFNPA